MKVVHIIIGLGVGGAETTLLKLLSSSDRRKFDHVVISLTSEGEIGQRIQELGIPVYSIGIRLNSMVPVRVWRLWRILRKIQPDLVQTWMYHANALGGVVSKLASRSPVVWNIRTSDPSQLKRTTRIIAKACALMSFALPSKIVYCARTAQQLHEDYGYNPRLSLYIPNGFDTSVYRPDPEGAAEIRIDLGLSAETSLIGLVARYHRVKDQSTFIDAASILSKNRPDVHFLLCGKDISWENSNLVDYITSRGLQSRFHLLDLRADTPRVFSTLDIHTMCSVTEGFPNVVGEAMACGTPCIVTDVGDAAILIGSPRFVVPPKSPGKLASAWEDVLAFSAADRSKEQSRIVERVGQLFSLSRSTEEYEAAYLALVR